MILRHREELTADWIRRALNMDSIEDIEVADIGEGAGAMNSILRCTLIHDRKPESVIVKLSSPDKSIRRIAKLLSMYRREYLCFRQLAPDMPIGIPELLYGDFDQSSHDFTLVMEDLNYMESKDQLVGADAETARRAVRAIAELHGRYWNRLDRPPASDFLAAVGGPKPLLTQLIYLWSLPTCIKRFQNLFSDQTRRLAEAFGHRTVDYLRISASGPQTLTHGDFRLDNLFFNETGVTVIDWQTCGLNGNGLYDVAYFMVTSVPTEIRRQVEREVLAEYQNIVGMDDYCWNTYRNAVLGMLIPAVCAGGALDMSNERIRALGEAMLRRTLTAIDDLHAIEFLPAGGGDRYFSRLLYRLCRVFR